MATFSYTYTLTNGTTADATQVQQNFTDVRNGISDGTSDISVAACTVAGNFTANGTTNTIGNASSDDFVLTASLASSVAIKTDSTYDIATTSTRVRAIYADSLYATHFGTATAKSADYTVLDQDNISTILMTTAASNRTVTLPTAADNAHRVLSIKKVDSGAGTCIIDGEGAETIEGATTLTLFKQYESVVIQCDGTAWYIVDACWAVGTYTPTITSGTNVAATTAATTHFQRTGKNQVLVWGEVSIDTTSTGATDFGISIPIASNFAASTNCAGTGGRKAGAGTDCFRISADTTNDRAAVEFSSNDTDNETAHFMFGYEII